MRAIIEDVRWELQQRETDDIDILVSGGIGVGDINRLRDVADGFGVGGAIADADPIDFSLNLVAVEGEPRAKRGVRSGAKTVYRDGYDDKVVVAGETAPGEKLLKPLIRDGEKVRTFDIAVAADRAREAIPTLRNRGVFDTGGDK
jgi:Nicotinic acid phosphoribosyltransferase